MGVHYLTLATLTISGIITLAFTKPLWEKYLLYVMRTAEAMFLPYKSKTNRLDIIWESMGDFFLNIGWGLPSSLIGPTFMETINRPAFAPFFLEGLFSILLMIFVILNTLQLIKVNSALRKVVIYGFLPAAVVAIIIHYPFGIFNPGSATRYKQALVPLLYLYPLLLQGEWRRKKYFEKNNSRNSFEI